MRAVAAGLVMALGLGPAAWAGPAGRQGIETRDVPGTDGDWQEGHAVIDAPIDEVRRWHTDFERWPQSFPDVQWAKVLSRSGNDRAVMKFRSSIIGRDLTLNMHWNARAIVYRGVGKNVDVQGKVLLTPLGRGRTDVVLQSTADVHGIVGALASKATRRARAYKKLRADLGALQNLSRTRM